MSANDSLLLTPTPQRNGCHCDVDMGDIGTAWVTIAQSRGMFGLNVDGLFEFKVYIKESPVYSVEPDFAGTADTMDEAKRKAMNTIAIYLDAKAMELAAIGHAISNTTGSEWTQHVASGTATPVERMDGE